MSDENASAGSSVAKSSMDRLLHARATYSHARDNVAHKSRVAMPSNAESREVVERKRIGEIDAVLFLVPRAGAGTLSRVGAGRCNALIL